MAEDDKAYRRSVRNMVFVLAAIVLTVFAAIFIPPIVNPLHEQFNQSGYSDSVYGFRLTILLNATQLASNGGVAVTAWLNNTSSETNNVTAASQWPAGLQGLWTRICTNGWPLGVGVMPGYFTQDNYTRGSLIRVPVPLIGCPVSIYTPTFFLMQPGSSTAIVRLNGVLSDWNLTTTLSLGSAQLSRNAGSGVFTAVAADEWGDVAIAHFRIA